MPNGIRRRDNRAGFTLIELLVVIGIIVILVGILLPVVATMRKKAQQTDTFAEITRIAAAINHYYQDFRANPGPLPESAIYGNNGVTSQTPGITATTGTAPTAVSSSENLVLGLCGGLVPPTTATATSFAYNIANLTPPAGPKSLNYMSPQTWLTYYDPTTAELANNGAGVVTSWTTTPGVVGAPTPTGFTIPELMDHFSNPHPIIYLRAVVGGTSICDTPRSTSTPGSQYFFNEVNPYWRVYTSTTVLTAAALPTAAAFTTKDGGTGVAMYPTSLSFFQNPTLADNVTPRAKDGFILISPGYDGIYGTPDDVVYPPP